MPNANNNFVKIKRLNPAAAIPAYAYPGDACADLFACLTEPILLESGQTKIVPTGLAMDPGPDMEILIRSRSGLASKGIVVANSPGTVDPTFTGEIGVILKNTSSLTFVINHGTKIAQMTIKPIFKALFIEVDELDVTDRGANGFGSSGI